MAGSVRVRLNVSSRFLRPRSSSLQDRFEKGTKKKNKNDLVTDLEQGRPEQGDQRVEEEGTTRVVSGSRGAQ